MTWFLGCSSLDWSLYIVMMVVGRLIRQVARYIYMSGFKLSNALGHCYIAVHFYHQRRSQEYQRQSPTSK
jgi:hypothetical protein